MSCTGHDFRPFVSACCIAVECTKVFICGEVVQVSLFRNLLVPLVLGLLEESWDLFLKSVTVFRKQDEMLGCILSEVVFHERIRSRLEKLDDSLRIGSLACKHQRSHTTQSLRVDIYVLFMAFVLIQEERDC